VFDLLVVWWGRAKRSALVGLEASGLGEDASTFAAPRLDYLRTTLFAGSNSPWSEHRKLRST
jgi:hypothetical protein